MILRWLRLQFAEMDAPVKEFYCRFCKKRFLSDTPDVVGKRNGRYYHLCTHKFGREVQLVTRKWRDLLDHSII